MKKTIIVADDEEAQRELVAEYFERHGFTVVALANGAALRDALDLYDDVVAIVTDNNMPLRTGLQVLREIHGDPRYAHIKRFLVSGVQGMTVGVLGAWAEDAGARLFTKPVDLAQILKVLRS